ncbi:molecular chaperone [Geomonas silvestris]|uniref:Molecular chaperone n=1 Tax=Geomonas silvestris TaxID=2740184 RepID=A0A6V8MJI3_9BACT|nr:Hsp20/alpha crystallin family protein [Geomonas silvestris]GFO59839.1 molecular chaperone [Geomonas silvestris]
MAVIPKEPLEWLGLFRQQMDEIFRYLSTLEGREGYTEQEISPLVDIYETPTTFVVEVELPGCEVKDITLSICCSTLVVEAIARDNSVPAGVNYICLERAAGRFCRAVEVPPNADLDRVKARYRRGLLTVEFPRSKDKKTHIREITIE